MITPVPQPTLRRAMPPALVRNEDRRSHQRVHVALLGRYMLSDRMEYPCQTVDMSPGGVRLTCAVLGRVGERIVIYLEHIGRVEGEIVRPTPGGFAASIAGTIRKRDKIASQLTWLANRASLGLPEDRRHERLTPRQTLSTLRVEGRPERVVRVIDFSLSGVALAGDDMPPIGTAVLVGKTAGRVVRHFQGGTAIEFLLPISPERFDENLVF